MAFGLIDLGSNSSSFTSHQTHAEHKLSVGLPERLWENLTLRFQGELRISE